MKCPHCHKDIRPTDHFCPHCGYDLRRNPPRSTSILGRMMKGYLVIMLLTVALPMAIIFCYEMTIVKWKYHISLIIVFSSFFV